MTAVKCRTIINKTFTATVKVFLHSHKPLPPDRESKTGSRAESSSRLPFKLLTYSAAFVSLLFLFMAKNVLHFTHAMRCKWSETEFWSRCLKVNELIFLARIFFANNSSPSYRCRITCYFSVRDRGASSTIIYSVLSLRHNISVYPPYNVYKNKNK